MFKPIQPDLVKKYARSGHAEKMHIFGKYLQKKFSYFFQIF